MVSREASATTSALFIVGCGRSGTTLVYRMICRHRDATWISTWSDRLTSPLLARASTNFLTESFGETLRLRPSEGYRTWDKALPDRRGDNDGVLSAVDLTESERARISRVISAYQRSTGRGLFVNKNTRNTRRVGFLAEAQPDAAFLHVLRHPLDVVSSLLNVAWWPGLSLWTEGGATPEELLLSGQDSARAAANLWVAETTAAMSSGQLLGESRYQEVRYESIVQSPTDALVPVLRRLGVDVSDALISHWKTWDLRSSAGAWRTRLTAAQRESVWDICAPLASRLGYEVS